MTPSFERLKPDDDLQKAARLMRQAKLEGLPVIADGRFIGIMTKANLYDALAVGMSPDTPVKELFTRKVVTLYEDMSYEEAAEIVRTSRVGIVVVLDKMKELAGIITKAGWIMAMFKKRHY